MARYYDPVLERWVSMDDQEGGAPQSIDYGSGVYINPVTGNYYTQDDPVGVQMPVSQISAMSGEGFGGTAGIVAPGWMHPDATTGSLMPLDVLLGASSSDPYNLYRDATLAPEQLSARNDFISAFPGYGQVGTPYFNDDGSYKAYGTPGGFLIDPNNVINDPTYGPITTLDNFGYAGGKGGHGDAVTALLAMAAAGYGSSLLGAGADAAWGVNQAGTAAAGGAGAGPTLAADALLAGAGPTVAADAAAFGAGGALGGGATGLELGALGGIGGAGAVGAGLGTSVINSAFPGAMELAGSLGNATSVPNFSNYINSGSLNGSTATTPPPIPGAEAVGNGVGLTEAAQAGSAATGATSAIGRILGGNATASDWASILGTVGATGLGLAGANSQSNALKDVYNQQMSMGAPYRDMLAQSYQPGFSMANQPDFQNALNIGADAAARATSAKVGNPVDNPGAYAEMQKYISGSLALPQLNQYRSQLGTFGQLGTNTAGAAALGQAQSQGGTYNALGYGLGQLTQPDNPFKGLLSQFGKQNAFSF